MTTGVIDFMATPDTPFVLLLPFGRHGTSVEGAPFFQHEVAVVVLNPPTTDPLSPLAPSPRTTQKFTSKLEVVCGPFSVVSNYQDTVGLALLFY